MRLTKSVSFRAVKRAKFTPAKTALSLRPGAEPPARAAVPPMETIVLLLTVSFLPGGALGAGCSWGAQNIQIAPYLGCAPSSAQANACSQSCDAPMPCSRTGQIASAALACRALPPFLRRPRTSQSTTTTTVCARVSRSNRWQSHARTPSTPGARRSSTTTTSSTPPPPHLAQVTSRPRCATAPQAPGAPALTLPTPHSWPAQTAAMVFWCHNLVTPCQLSLTSVNIGTKGISNTTVTDSAAALL